MIGTTAEPAPSPGTYFNSVKSSIPADVAFANLEGTLTDQTSGKCATLPAGTCYEFKLPPSYARYYKQAGFTMMSNGNNHAFDFWQAGLDDTVAALDHAGLDHTGRTTEITYVDVRGIRTAFIGFGPYPNNAPLNDFTKARELIHKADANADLVVVSMHAGAEGSGAQHLTGADEIYYGENRGNPEAFARTAIDAGADLVLGSGPHVLRAMEFYKKRLIAYSLGDFAGYHNFGIDGVLGISAILRVKLDATGKFIAGRIVPVRLVGAGQPVIDSSGAGISVISQLSREDIGARAPHISPSGVISEP
jgi:poly-gamma-glutamate capsule biosynthesis protein CapA/YwtB (metallophosphatase superfamily)